MSVPLLFLSDAVSASSGLGRITRDLAMRVHEHLPDLYRVGAAGYGGVGSKAIPFQTYHLHDIKNWLVPELPQIWSDFAGDEPGIIMCIWDASRLYWMGLPQTCPIPHLRRWVEGAKIKKWIYGAIDAEGPYGKLPHRIKQTYEGFDRVLDYSRFSTDITGHTEYLPHGIDTKVFYPRDPVEARASLIKSGFKDLTPDALLVGIVATNQVRKNWQLAMETLAILVQRGYDVRAWIHTDIIDRYWSLDNLVVDYGLVGRVVVTLDRFTDDHMAWLYSACDVTLGIGPEGWGFPIAESLACGVPCIVGSYGAQAEFVPQHMQVRPVAYYYEGAFCSKRPVHDATKWADKMESVKRKAAIPNYIDWHGSTLCPDWIRWFREGIV